MNKIKQNKITFILILSAIAIIFSSLTILSLPVLFNYKSKVNKIEKNFYKNFKIYLNSYGKISYKPFPKPHLLVENASLYLSESEPNKELITSKNLKIFISLKDIYLRSFSNLVSTQISDTNLELKMSDVKEIRKHLYKKVNKPIVFKNCKIFLKNKKDDVILISPIKKISYKIDKKNKIKNFSIGGKVFGLNFKSEWKRNYDAPKSSIHNINIFNPNIEIKNIFEFNNPKEFTGNTQITYAQDKIEYNLKYENEKINISSPNNKKSNFNLNSKIQFKPFYFVGDLTIKKLKIEKIIDSLLINYSSYNKDYLGNFNGELSIKFDDLNNKLIKKGKIDIKVKEKKIILRKAKFNLDKIGKINSDISILEDNGIIKFISQNQLIIENYIEFAKIFQIGSKKIKNIKFLNFDVEKIYGNKQVIISNIMINNNKNKKKNDQVFLISNIQNLRSNIRKVID